MYISGRSLGLPHCLILRAKANDAFLSGGGQVSKHVLLGPWDSER